MIQDTAGNQTLAFAITDNNGAYKLMLPSNKGSIVKLRVRALNHEPQEKIISMLTAIYDFTLVEREEVLPEIIVIPKPIEQKGDTLKYNVSAFSSASDRSIEDVIKNMPGLTVSNDGKIFYQGRVLEKLYIEGLDLLEGKYSLATKNLPKFSVSEVQILQNHQPIRILDSIIFSDRPSLNLKLAKNISFTGIAQTGIGGKPFVWDISLMPMMFKKNQQWIGGFQSNNAGHDIGSQLQIQTLHEYLEGLNIIGNNSNYIFSGVNSPPLLANNRHLFNESYLSSVNMLQRFKNDWQLKLNLSYLTDKKEFENSNNYVYQIQNGVVRVDEKIKINERKNPFILDLTLMNNTPKNYFKTKSAIELTTENSIGTINYNNVLLKQLVPKNISSFSNNLSSIYTIGKQLISLNSSISYRKRSEELEIYPGVFNRLLNGADSFGMINQSIIQEGFSTNNNLQWSSLKRKWHRQIKPGLKYSTNEIYSQITNEGHLLDTPLINNLTKKIISPYLDLSIHTQQSWGKLTLTVPAAINLYRINNRLIPDTTRKNGFFLITPSVFWFLDKANGYSYSANISYGSIVEGFERLLPSYVLTSYRLLSLNNFPLFKSSQFRFGLSQDYKNLEKLVFFRVGYTLSIGWQPFILNTRLDDFGSTQIETYDIPNKKYNHSLNIASSKYLAPLKTTIYLNLNSSISNTKILVNNNLVETNSLQLLPELRLTARISKNYGFEYAMKNSWNKLRIDQHNPLKTTRHSQELALKVYLAKKHLLQWQNEFYLVKDKGNQYNMLFSDILYRHTFQKQKIDLELEMRNLFNHKYFSTVTVESFYMNLSKYAVRPRQGMLSVKYQLFAK